MAGWSQTEIIGNVGADPEMRFLQNGTAVCSFRVAVTRKWSDRETNEPREKTTWYKVTCWRKLAETANSYVHKGSQLFVVGNMDEPNAYIDKNGQPAASLQMTADYFQLLGGRGDNAGGGDAGGGDYSGGSGGGSRGGSSSGGGNQSADDIPF